MQNPTKMQSFADRMNVQLTTSPDKKEAILHSTLHLIHQFGFHGTPMSRIAEEAQVAIGSIYHYFSSKDELIIELFKYTKRNTYQAMLEQDNEVLPYKTRFFNIWSNLVLYYIKFPAVMSFLDQFYSSPFAKIVLTSDTFCLQDEVARFLEIGIREKEIKDLDINILSSAFVGTVIATAKRHSYGHFIFDKARLNDMAGIIWDGIRRE